MISGPSPSAGPEGRLILGSAPEALAFLAEELSGAVDLVYMDPPFFSGKRRRGHRGSFEDRWEEPGEYLELLYETFRAVSRLLSDKGQVFVHLDWRVAHWARCLMDEVFGPQAFRNEIVWHYGTGGRPPKRGYARKWDAILWYAPGHEFVFRPERTARPRNRCPKCGTVLDRVNHMKRGVGGDGRKVLSIRSGGRIYEYHDDDLVPRSDVWLDVPHIQQLAPERTGYPTQKPLMLLERILQAHSDAGDLVLDPFCGSGTTCVAAHRLGRRWVGCDTNPQAISVCRERLEVVLARTGGSVSIHKLALEPESDKES